MNHREGKDVKMSLLIPEMLKREASLMDKNLWEERGDDPVYGWNMRIEQG